MTLLGFRRAGITSIILLALCGAVVLLLVPQPASKEVFQPYDSVGSKQIEESFVEAPYSADSIVRAASSSNTHETLDAEQRQQQEDSRTSPVDDGSRNEDPVAALPFLTSYQKTTCGATVQNMCIKGGQPRYVTTDGQLLTRSGATTVCNEAVRKSKLHMVVTASSSQQELPAYPMGPGGNASMLLVPFCWELYGYHLLLCIMSAWANARRHGVCLGCPDPHNGHDNPIVRHVVVGFLKGSGQFPFLRGSSSSWDSFTPPLTFTRADRKRPIGVFASHRISLPSKAESTPYWPLWRGLTDDPSNVWPLSDIEPSCYRHALLGHIPSVDVTPQEQMLFRDALLRRVLFGFGASSVKRTVSKRAADAIREHLSASVNGTTEQVDVLLGRLGLIKTNGAGFTASSRVQAMESLLRHRRSYYAANCRQDRRAKRTSLRIRVTLIQRAKRYSIQNIGEVEDAIRRGVLHTARRHHVYPVDWSVDIRTVVLENITVVRQIALAALGTDLLVGVHGNGLSWSMLLEPTAAVMELWPHVPYNANYVTFANRGNLFYKAVTGNGDCRSRCSATYNAAAVEAAAADVAQHLWAVRCRRESFNVTRRFYEDKEQSAKRKRERSLLKSS